MDDKIYMMTRKELQELIESTVEGVFARYIPELMQELTKEEELTDTKTVCAELKISRQTLNNWRNSPNTKNLIAPFISKRGGKVLYNLKGIKQTISQYAVMFGRNKDYDYKFEATATEAERINKRYRDINGKIMTGAAISDADKEFYRETCKQRGLPCLLRD
jgi:hypothetical protein